MRQRGLVILLTFALFAQLFFLGYNVLTGRVYAGAAVDSSFLYFMMAVDIIPLICFSLFLISKQSKKNVWLLVTILIVVFLLLLIEGGISNIKVKSFLAYSIPSAFIGIIISKHKAGDYFAKWLEPIMVFLTVVGIRSMSLIMTLSISGVGDEGIGIQSLSYHCAFAFALNLYFLLFGDELNNRFGFAKTFLYKVFSIALLVAQVVVTLSSGGRGGFVLLAVSAASLLIIKIIRQGAGSFSKIITCFLLLAVAFVAIQFMPNSVVDTIRMGSERTFSYISKRGIDMRETSNRDIVYAIAINTIKERPALGYGLLIKGTFFENSWPHNIILEVLLQGGVIFLLFCFGFFINLTIKIVRMLKEGHGLFIIPILLYPLVMLCFSGSYLSTGLFWFSLTYIICYDLDTPNISWEDKYDE